ncbi:MAG: 2-dehydropantoate 2-reductase [Anaerolineales bacterium]
MKILSLGAGAIGTYIGGSLAKAGHSVTFVEQPAVVDLLNKSGLTLDLSLDPRRQAGPRFTLKPPAVTFSASLADSLTILRPDLILFALKSFDTQSALKTLAPLYHSIFSGADAPPVLCLQNGVENEAALAAALGAQNVIAATVTSAIGRRPGGEIVLEKLRGVGVAAGHPLSAQIARALNEALLNGQIFPRAADMKWSKLLTNLLANPASAILDLPAAEIFAHPGLYRLEIAQLRECLAVMRAQHINVVDLPGTPVRALALAARLPAWLSKPFLAKAAGAGRGAKMPSFHIDLYAGRKQSEVLFLHGAVARFGKKLGVPTPVNQFLTDTLLALSAGRLPLDTYAHQPEKFLQAAETHA